MRANIHQTAGESIYSAQEKQRRDYNRRCQMLNKINVGEKVLLQNQRRMNRKSCKFSFKWFGPFKVHSISNMNFCSLKNKDGTLIKTKYNVSLLKPKTPSLYRSNHRRCSLRKGILRNFAKFTGKHLCQGLFFNKVAGFVTLLKSHFGMGFLLKICCIFSEHLFKRTPMEGCF